MSSYVLEFQAINATHIMQVGGKGANLAELAKIEGLSVPDGFCISTAAFKHVLQEPVINELIDQLSLLKANERALIAEWSQKIRTAIETAALPANLSEAVSRQISKLGATHAYAIRSSATAEDLPTASFAGQHDTYLNIIGESAILSHISKCWASLFTQRAVIYRIQHGFDHRDVSLAVVVQKMGFPQAAGIMFTADPITSNRHIVAIDAGFGLGEALVSGLVNADRYHVRNGTIIDTHIAVKQLAVYALEDGGTTEQIIEPERQHIQVLTDAQIVRLERIGRTIEKHFGAPQDIEWCLVDETFHIVQSRPITTLYPIPEAHDQANHVYVSVGHQQMMTDAMKPLGLSVWQLTAARPMHQAGGRLFVDITNELASPTKREIIVNGLGKSDPLIQDALMTIIERGDFIPLLRDETAAAGPRNQGPALPNFQTHIDYDPTIVPALIQQSEASLEALKQTIQTQSGSELFDFILEDIQQLKNILTDPRGFGVIMTAINASIWLNEAMMEWLGEKNAADTLTLSAPNNITSAMGLALLDVADVIRPYPDVIEYLKTVNDDDFLDQLAQFNGGKEVQAAIKDYLHAYGMRGVGEIDITKPRWSENPSALIPLLLSNIKNFEPNASTHKFQHGLRQALSKEQELLERLQQLPDGEQKSTQTKHMIDLVRNFIGYREYPKYSMVHRYLVYKQALLKEAERLVQAQVIHDKDDVYYLTFDEFHHAVRDHTLDYALINQRKAEYKRYEKLTPPRVITSDGEILSGHYKRADLPATAIAGLAVSSGATEGRARVIRTIHDANLEPGDILVTAFTDPSWTPLFVSIQGLVTEVGGLMTHGSVIAREYGIPAVVGVHNATKRIKDGQRIRVNGTDGYVEIL